MTTERFYKHPDFPRLSIDWSDYRAFFEGDRAALLNSKYLWKHEYETRKNGQVLRAIREQRTRYINFCKAIIQKYISITFQNHIDFKEIRDFFDDEEFNNIDGQGNSLESYIIKSIAEDYFVYGRVVDEVHSRLPGDRAYLFHWTPESLRDWQISADNNDQYLFSYTEIPARSSLHEQPEIQSFLQYSYLDNLNKYVVERYKVDTEKDETAIIDDVFETQLDFVPVAFTDSESWVKPILHTLMSLYNLQSAEDNILNFQAFQKIFLSGEFQEGDGAIVMESGLTMLPSDTTVTTIEPCNPVALKDRIERGKADLWRVAFYQSRIMPDDSRNAEGAATQLQQKEDLVSALALAGESIANHVNDLVRKFVMFKGKQINEQKVIFDFKNLIVDDEQINNFIALFSADAKKYKVWNRELMRYAAKRMNLDNIEEVLTDIQETADVVSAPAPTFGLRGLLNEEQEI